MWKKTIKTQNLPVSVTGDVLEVVVTALSGICGVVGITRMTPLKYILPSLLITGTDCER